ncbi:unnamed protein product, partial [Polarella glacialis]
ATASSLAAGQLASRPPVPPQPPQPPHSGYGARPPMAAAGPCRARLGLGHPEARRTPAYASDAPAGLSQTGSAQSWQTAKAAPPRVAKEVMEWDPASGKMVATTVDLDALDADLQ